jgi:hypothetical protein
MLLVQYFAKISYCDIVRPPTQTQFFRYFELNPIPASKLDTNVEKRNIPYKFFEIFRQGDKFVSAVF